LSPAHVESDNSGAVMVNMDIKLDGWKNRLLDLGKRNPMLNYRDTKRGNLRILKPGINELWQHIVIDERPLEFPIVEQETIEDIDAEGEDNESADAENVLRFEDDFSTPGLKTNKTFQEQQRTLRNLRNKSRTFMEEQGINALYLSFGFLHWSEAGHSDVFYDAPLILVPVTITWESITAPFVLNLHDDEIVINPTLQFKLETEYGIKLPEFNEDGSIDLYFSRVRDTVSANGWSVKKETGLGMLSFLKINMYNDLERHRDVIVNNPIIRAIAGDSTTISHDISQYDGYDHDSVKPSQVFQIVDADSSQQDAILCAKKGVSFVLQGPPGTGKSQTITNIIAECLADGKKVLFVAEKMAALDVVYRRLSDAWLGDFCLILHSHKANKKDTLKQLGDVLKLASKKATISRDLDQQLSRLSSDRKALNEYAKEVYETIEPLGITIYEANGRIAELQDIPEVIFSIPDIKKTTPEKLEEYLAAIRQYAIVLEQMNNNIDCNPWKGASVEYVTNELRHDINADAPKFLESIQVLTDKVDEFSKELSIKIDSSHAGIRDAVQLLSVAAESPKVPQHWLDDYSNLLSLRNDIDEHASAQRSILQNVESLGELSNKIQGLDSNTVYTCDPDSFATSDGVKEYFESVRNAYDSDECYKIWAASDDQQAIKEACAEALTQFQELNSINESISSTYEKDIFTIDYNSIYLQFKTECASALKIFNGQYRAHKKLFTGLLLGVGKKIGDNEIIDVLMKLRRREELNDWVTANETHLKNLLGPLYKGITTDFSVVETRLNAFDCIKEYIADLEQYRNRLGKYEENYTVLQRDYGDRFAGLSTNWSDIQNALDWAEEFTKALQKYPYSDRRFIKESCEASNAESCRNAIAALDSYVDSIKPQYDWFIGLFDDSRDFDNITMPALYDHVKACTEQFSSLEEWIDLRNHQRECNALGLNDFVVQTDEKNIPGRQLEDVFLKRFYRLWLDKVLPEYPAVANFRRKAQEQTLDEFKYLDKIQFEIAKAKIRAKLIDRLPSVNHFTSGVDEISILRRELGKQRRIMPIRKLFREIPNLIMTLKPCLMMSPLSVSLFLESDCFNFDTVIFDEASQVYTESAVGAILRGKQVIIAGDSHQLPPTSFFMAGSGENDYDLLDEDGYVDDSSSFESVLDEAALLPERTLLWHYRSRHEHLIAYSNAKIYRNELVTFPSNIDKAPDLGVEYVYVKDGIFERGGKRCNIKEAEKIAELVFDHFRRFPKRSLGVIAFGEAQANAIDAAIRKRRLTNQDFESFFTEEGYEPFFVKSLENVQGDERDTIIFSIGYAKDAQGRMSMNFGPLNTAGGERRLNVAITRAKYNVKLVGSILPTDIDLNRTAAEGPKLLRGYIEFAIHGPSVLGSETTESEIVSLDSPFEESVYRFLEDKNYQIATQVGCSGYRIDMAIKHPTLSGRYVIGIECDGASYHSARTARERDRLRQDVLESMGWKIYRIWSTDWIKDPITEGQKLVEAIDAAINGYVDNDVQALHTEQETVEQTDYIVEEDKPEDTNVDNPYGFADYVEANLRDYDSRFNVVSPKINAILNVVYQEYPVHFERICQLVAPMCGKERVSSVVRNDVKMILDSMQSRVREQNNYYWPKDVTEVPVRVSGPRSIQHISKDELSEGMKLVLTQCIGVGKDQLINETVRAFGFTRKGSNITEAMNIAYNRLKRTGAIVEYADKVFTADNVPNYAGQDVEYVSDKHAETDDTPTIIYDPDLIIKGSRVHHKKHGYGTVSYIKDGIIKVSLDDGDDKKYQFPSAVNLMLLGYVKPSSKAPVVVDKTQNRVLERRCENCDAFVRGDCGGVRNPLTCTDYKQKLTVH